MLRSMMNVVMVFSFATGSADDASAEAVCASGVVPYIGDSGDERQGYRSMNASPATGARGVGRRVVRGGYGPRAGCVALVAGSAGAGKTSLVRAALAESPNVLWGMCDPFTAPAALGPLRDLSDDPPDDLIEFIDRDGRRADLFAGLLRFLTERSVVLAVEDVHWADDATLDMLTYLGRRIAATGSSLVCTFRSDELSRDHPLQPVLAVLGPAALRLDVPPLSPDAVAQLVHGSGLDPSAVHARTLGNAFFVTAVLAAPHEQVPTTVEAAVLARARRLRPTACALLDAVALAPDGLSSHTIASLAATNGIGPLADIDAVRASGLVIEENDRLRCQHDLVRMALSTQISGPRRTETHRRVLAALDAVGNPDPAVRAHHAIGAGDGPITVVASLHAGRDAVVAGARRQAARHYANALRHPELIPSDELDDVMYAASYQAYLTNDMAGATAWAEQRTMRLTGPVTQGDAHRWLSRLRWFSGQPEEAFTEGQRAVDALEPHGATPQLALAYSNLSQFAMLHSRPSEVERWATLALELAEQLQLPDVESHAMNNLGTALMIVGDLRGEPLLRRALALALDDGLGEHAARAYTNLGYQLSWQGDLHAARELLERGIDYCSREQLDSWVDYMSGTLAVVTLRLGDPERAAQMANALLERDQPVANQQQPLEVLALLAIRAGDLNAAAAVERHTAVAERMGKLRRVVLARIAECELVWTTGSTPNVDASTNALDRSRETGDSSGAARLAWWLVRLGGEPPSKIGEWAPAAIVAGAERRWVEAAAEWRRLGCSFEAALDSALTLEREPVRVALDALGRLGATASAAALRRELRARGMHAVPRGGAPASLANSAGLTAREQEVLALLADGATNAEIGARLYISPKTVGHHVSAILSKLHVTTRRQATIAARELDLHC